MAARGQIPMATNKRRNFDRNLHPNSGAPREQDSPVEFRRSSWQPRRSSNSSLQSAADLRRPARLCSLRQQATLVTRPEKQHRSLSELTMTWRQRADRLVGSEPQSFVSALAHRNDLPLLRARDLDEAMLREAASLALAVVADRRATFTRSNVFAEVTRQLHGVRFACEDDRIAVLARTTALAVGDALIVSLPEIAHTPHRFLRPDGTSRLRPVDAVRYTTSDLLHAEAQLIEAGRDTSGPRIVLDPDGIRAHSEQPTPAVSREQEAAICAIVSSGRRVDVLVGAAGTGKTTTLAAVRQVWEDQHGEGSVRGLAPSASAAETLAGELGIDAENTAKFVYEAANQAERRARLARLEETLASHGEPIARRVIGLKMERLEEEITRCELERDDLVIVDEASLAGTHSLDQIRAAAVAAGAKVLLVGDWAQLAPVQAAVHFEPSWTTADPARPS
jgi:hypothetical protein